MKVTAQLYGQFLLSSQVNYTGTYLAEHLDGLTHDNVRYFFKTRRFTPRQLWQQVRAEVVLNARGYVLFDDTVLDKRHSRRIELVRRQYSGNAHGVMAGIGLVTCVYVNPDTDQFWLITTASLPRKTTAKPSSTTWPTCGRSWPRAAAATRRCLWTAGMPPRSWSSGSWTRAKRFTAP